ncbi:uncharacterized protein JCM10292_005632 [Rhodotorula paludigena]|uniref:uncharacterized protein n=1 Tax=Rhodotorula paludigena TaxID=86838 RepID=UPI00316F478A
MGSTSPFRRRPALARTYGSSSTSAAAASTAASSAAAAAAAPTSERRTSAHAGTRGAHKKDQGSLAALLAGLSESSDDDGADARGSERAKMRAAEASSKRQGGPAVQTSARRTRSAAAASTTEAETERGAPRGLQGEGSAFWDEARTAADRPKAPKKRASTGGADARAEGDGAGEVRAKRARVSAPAGRGAAMKHKGKGKDIPDEDEDEDEIPAPFDYVPLAERVQLSSPHKPPPSPAPVPARTSTGDIDDLPESRFRPLAGLTRASRAAAAAAASADSSASLAKPANAAASTLAPNKASPAPTRSPAKRTRSTTAASPAAKAPAPSPAPAPAKPVRPPSPAKDLSAIFSRFSAAPAGASVAEGAKQDGRTRLRRSESNSTAATAAAAAAPAGSAMGGGLRAVMLGRRRGAQEPAAIEEEREGHAEIPSPSRDSTRNALDRALSQPNISSSPLSSPARSPQRPALSAAFSQPTLGSPSRLAPFAPSREASPSPARPGPARLPSGGMGPALGSSYRPMPFAPPAPAFGTGLGAGGTRTYAGGARTLRRDVEEEAFFRPAAEAAPPSSASTSSAPEHRLPSLPPSLSRRTIGSRTSSTNTAGAAPPPAARETYASLRQRWGIDAEESLVDSEEHDSQDRGARVVGGGVLRKQGEGKRWNDELGWVLEGLRAGADGDRSAARASALDLLEKLQSRDWLRRLKASGEAESIYLALRLASYSPSPPEADHPAEHLAPDRVLDTAFATLLALLVRDQRLAEPLFRLSPSDVSRERAKRAPSAVDGTGDSQGSAAAALARTQSAGDDSQMTSSSAGWSSSPRKAAGAAAAEVDERSDLLELLIELGQRDWVEEEVGKAKAKDEAGDEEQAAGGRMRGKKVLRGDARHLQSLRNLIDAADLFPSSTSQPVSLRTLVLVITRSIATFVPRTIFQPQHLLCASGLFDKVVQVFLDECSAVDERLQKYETGLDLLPPPSSTVPSFSLVTLSSCLAIFEATSLATPYAFHLISMPSLLPSLAHALTHLTLVAFLLALDGPDSAQQDRATQQEALGTLTAALGILFGLTTESSWGLALVDRSSASPTHGAELVAVLVRIVLACRRHAKEDVQGTTITVRRAAVIKEEDEGDSAAPSSSSADNGSRAGEEASGANSGVGAAAALWDVMSLAMGVLANLAESADEAFKLRVRELRTDLTCHGKRKCALRCHCVEAQADEPATTVIGVLAQLALDPLEDAPNSIYHHSITGFLRLVLGLSILDSPTNEELVLAVLASEPTPLSSSLGPILDALEQLAQLHDEQRAAQSELLASSAGLIGAAPSGADDGAEEDAFESQRTEVDETQRDEGGGGEDEMDGLVVSRAAGEDDDAPRRMREVVQRLRRRIA